MKKLPLEPYNLKFDDVEGTVDTGHVIEYCLNIPPQGGFTPKDLKDAARIQAAVDQARVKADRTKDKRVMIDLEDQDAENLKNIVARSRWASRNAEILRFILKIEKL